MKNKHKNEQKKKGSESGAKGLNSHCLTDKREKDTTNLARDELDFCGFIFINCEQLFGKRTKLVTIGKLRLVMKLEEQLVFRNAHNSTRLNVIVNCN
jgi:hypothetical protein